MQGIAKSKLPDELYIYKGDSADITRNKGKAGTDNVNDKARTDEGISKAGTDDG